MKYKLVNENFKSEYIKNLIASYGADCNILLSPPSSVLSDPLLLDNMDKGAALYLSIVDKPNANICLIVDCDADGFTSSSILWLYTKRYNPDINLYYKIHSGKQHGLEDMIDEIENESIKYDLVVLPDAGSNDYDYHRRLRDINIPVLVLDHHEAMEVSTNAIVINNQLSSNYTNKELTGAGVVYQFCRYLDTLTGNNWADDYVDLAALGIISDMGSVLNYENRYIIQKGLEKYPKNYFFGTLIEKQSFSIGNTLNPIAISFYVTPLINAMVRYGTMEEKENMFLAFIDGRRIVPSTKRGEKGKFEDLATQVARVCGNVRTHQNKDKDNAVEQLKMKIFNDCLDENKILLVLLEDTNDFDSTLNGLVAMQLAAEYQKPTLVLRPNNEGFARGSARGLNNSEFNEFKSYLDSTEMFEYCAGHQNAFGASIKISDIDKFIKKSNEELEKYDFNNEYFDVNFIREAFDDDIKIIIQDVDSYKTLWGQGCPEPVIAIRNINIAKNDIQIIGKNNDTVKFTVNGITYIKFHAKDFIADINNYDSMNIELIGKCAVNEFAGRTTPQIQIQACNIKDNTLLF